MVRGPNIWLNWRNAAKHLLSYIVVLCCLHKAMILFEGKITKVRKFMEVGEAREGDGHIGLWHLGKLEEREGG